MDFDVIVIGGGIAGASVAFELAAARRVLVIERESAPGYHTTGRSAAMFLRSYGEAPVRALAAASRRHLFNPPEGFAEAPLVSPRSFMFVARADQMATLEAKIAIQPDVLEAIDGERACALVPALRPDYVAGAALEADAVELDVHGLHHGYLRGLKARGGRLVLDAEVTAITRRDGTWRVATRAGDFAAPVLIDAAGAWADEIAALAGATPVGLVPKRRTVIVFDPPEGVDPSPWPMVVDIDEKFYFRADAGRILASPADETPMPPCDVQPEELDIAIAIDRIERATSFTVRRPSHRWAGLRSFVDDHLPVIGYDDRCEGFFWLAGQGGIGIMTAPAVARLAAALVMGEDMPAEIAAAGVDAATFAPGRLARTNS